jgi:hypothetical protein
MAGSGEYSHIVTFARDVINKSKTPPRPRAAAVFQKFRRYFV